jgi:glycosyltransferase involved in cell wall biosynthesis
LKRLRIAFLTPEFVTEDSKLGGIAGFVYRMTTTLRDMNHIPEIFTLSFKNEGPIQFEGMRVERIPVIPSQNLEKIFKFEKKIFNLKLKKIYKTISFAIGVAKAVKRREKEGPYDFIHSSDYSAPGIFIRKRSNCPVIVRSSWVGDLCMKVNGDTKSFGSQITNIIERNFIRRADIAYAPSRFAAQHYFQKFKFPVKVIRPPFFLESGLENNFKPELPEKFFIHFGNIGPVKGSDTLSNALPIAWNEEPELKVVFVGRETQSKFIEKYIKFWGENASNVIWLGLLEKPKLFSVVKRAIASVLPSRTDNLPNTALESLSLGIPVIGTYGSSLDELIEPGFSGELIPIGDHKALSNILVKVWRKEVGWIGSKFRLPMIFKEMEPRTAAENLLRIARHN